VKRICASCYILDSEEGWPATFAAAGPQGCSVCAAGKPDCVDALGFGKSALTLLFLPHCSEACATEIKTVLRRWQPSGYRMVCSECDRSAARMQHCGRCRAAYCSEECQSAAWPAHREKCKPCAEGKRRRTAEGTAGRARCRVCRRKRALRSCERCGVGYCGNLCQKIDWFAGHCASCPRVRRGIDGKPVSREPVSRADTLAGPSVRPKGTEEAPPRRRD
jgi:hypothetical protein